MTIEEIRKLAEGYDHFLVERPVRTMAWFILSVLEAMNQRDAHLAQCQREADTLRQHEAYDEAEYQMTELRAAIARNMENRAQ